MEGTSKKFPSTDLSHSPTHSRGYSSSHLTTPSSSSHFQSSNVSSIFRLQWLTAALFSLFSHLFLLLLLLLLILLYFLSHTGFASCLHLVLFFFFFLFHLPYRRSSGSDFSFNREKKNSKCMPAESLISAGIC